MASYPIDRARNLLSGITNDPNYRTPKTMTGDSQGNVKSYALTIAEHSVDPTDTFKVHPRNNSRTTNRHISAVRMALHDMGYETVVTDKDGFEFWTRTSQRGTRLTDENSTN
jgi:hypothetical protein